MKFNKATPASVNDGKMKAPAGCSSFSDNDGNLLFYTNGKTVWNKNHQIMENGDNLSGDIDHTQSTIIIPKPNNDDTFFIFTTRKKKSDKFIDGLYFNEIKINNNFPLGKITQKNRRLNSFSAEKITAIHSADAKSIWVITLTNKISANKENFNSFFIYNVNENGVNLLPQRTLVNNIKPSVGTLKASPNGEIIVLTVPGTLYFYKFNTSTGEISQDKIITTAIDFTSGISAYGAEFSPNSKIMYYTGYEYGNGPPNFVLKQFDLSSNDIFQLGKTICSKPNFFPCSIQLGPNSKIYVSYNNDFYNGSIKTIGVINAPDKEGSQCDYIHDKINLNPNNSTRGLPNFISSYFRNRIITENKCVFDLFEFSLDSYAPITSVSWDFGDGNTSTQMNPKHSYVTPGEYTINATITINNKKNNIYKKVKVFPLPELIKNQKLVQCDDNNDGISLFNLNNINDKISKDNSLTYTFYKSLTEAQGNLNPILDPENFYNESNPQVIYTKAASINGCTEIESFTIESLFKPSINITPIIECEIPNSNGESNFDLQSKKVELNALLNLSKLYKISFFPTFEDAQKATNELPNIFKSSTTTIWVKIENENECSGISSIQLIVNNLPIIGINDSYTICVNPTIHPPIILNADNQNDKFEWKDINGNILSTNSQFTLIKTGKFSLTVYKTENGVQCSTSKDFLVDNPTSPNVTNLDVSFENEQSNSVYISVNGNSSYEYSLDNINFFGSGTSHTFNEVLPGINTIYVRDILKCEPVISTDVSVIGYSKFLTPNGDDKNDTWVIYGLKSKFFKKIDVTIFNRFGRVLYTINNQNAEQGWNGTLNGKPLPPNDYWFYAKLTDLKGNIIEKKGNFSLQKN